MKKITVSASKTYEVVIGNALLHQAGAYLKEIQKPCVAAIISDSNVWPLYGQRVTDSLTEAGFQVLHYTFPAGEVSKCADTYLGIVNFLAQHQLTRSDVLVALGGGVTGDITGFAAATFLRGISYIQIPTSLLAMVDSSVGGKTAIDLPAGKNLVGAFYQPSLVLCDMDTLSTLPTEVFRDGCAEVIKYGVLYDRELFRHLMEQGLDFCRETVIARCVALKRNVVAQDEFDTGARQMLNLGHTIGHGVEAHSNFTISHGKAVAIGMQIAASAGLSLGVTEACAVEEIRQILTKFSLPTATEFTADQLFSSALSDKKRSGGRVNLVIPRKIGDCILLPTEVTKLKAFIEAGLC